MGKVNLAISKSLILLIRSYQVFIGPWLGNCCRFHPSCSSFSIEAVKTHGIVRGLYFSLRRILRCHPWHKGGIDPVPEKISK